jgi:hypothetical protein
MMKINIVGTSFLDIVGVAPPPNPNEDNPMLLVCERSS